MKYEIDHARQVVTIWNDVPDNTNGWRMNWAYKTSFEQPVDIDDQAHIVTAVEGWQLIIKPPEQTES